MTEVLHWVRVEPMPASPRRRRRRHRRLRLVVAGLVLTVAAAGVSFYDYARHYQPWEFGGGGQWQGHHIVGITDGAQETGLIDTAAPGTLGWIGTTLRLSGRYSATVLRPSDMDGPGEVTLRWQVDDKMTASPDTATSRPVVVHPGQILTVWILVTRPSCPDADSSLSMRTASLRWKALGVTHDHVFPITQTDGYDLPLYLCYPKDALKHLFQP